MENDLKKLAADQDGVIYYEQFERWKTETLENLGRKAAEETERMERTESYTAKQCYNYGAGCYRYIIELLGGVAR